MDKAKHPLIVAAAAKAEYTFAMPSEDPREELASIAASLRAYLEAQVDTGAAGIPRKPREAKTATATSAREPAAAKAPTSLAVEPAAAAWAMSAPEPIAATSAPVASPAAAPPSAAAPRALEIIRAEVASCMKCGLGSTRKNTVFERGDPSAKLCFIGEAPGADEDASGIPFVGRAGQLLDKMIGAMGLDPAKDVYICNIIKCRPPGNRRPEPQETEACIPYLHEQLARIEPKAIVALGNTAVGALIGTKMGITKIRGSWKLYRGKIPVMPTYHPSYLLRPGPTQAESKRQVWEDLQTVMKELGLERKPRG